MTCGAFPALPSRIPSFVWSAWDLDHPVSITALGTPASSSLESRASPMRQNGPPCERKAGER